MSARTRSRAKRGQQASRSHDASDLQSKTQASTQDTPKRKGGEIPKVSIYLHLLALGTAMLDCGHELGYIFKFSLSL